MSRFAFWKRSMSEGGAVHRLLHAGAGAGDARARRRRVLANGVALSCLGSGLFYAVLLAALGFPGLGALLFAIAILYLGTIWLNHRGRYTASKLLLLATANTTVFIYLNRFGLAGEVSVFFATICLPLVIADLAERKTILFGFALSIGYALAMAIARERLAAAPLLAPGTAHGVRVSLVAMTFAVMLVAIVSFVVSNARAEARLDRARGGLQRLLDSVDQGFVTLDPAGRIGAERSAVFDAWFGAPAPGTSFADCLARLSPALGGAFRTGWQQIVEAFLPVEVLVEQLPARAESAGRHFRLRYRPDLAGEALTSVLVVITDVTAEVEHERGEAQQRELLRLMGRFAADPKGFRDFVQEADRLVDALVPGTAPATARARVHTLKGNCSFFGAELMVRHCHALEDRLADLTSVGEDDLRSVVGLWRELRERMTIFVGGVDAVALSRPELERLRRQIEARRPHHELAATLDAWNWEPTATRLGRIADQLRALAGRLGKGEVEVAIDDGGLRLDPERWSAFWASFAHLVRNAADHGLETPEERAQADKPVGRVALRTRLSGPELHIEIEDNGRGIDWPAVARRAAQQGLDHDTRTALEAALFADSFSTRDEITDTSGRGVGLGAVRAACRDLGGSIAVDSSPGRGTRFRFVFPAGRAVAAPDAAGVTSAR